MLRVVSFGVRKSVPVVIWAAGLFGWLILQDMGLWLAGARQAVVNMGQDAVKRAGERQVPSDYQPLIYWSATVLAIVELVIGWVALSYVTVFLMRVFFGL